MDFSSSLIPLRSWSYARDPVDAAEQHVTSDMTGDRGIASMGI